MAFMAMILSGPAEANDDFQCGDGGGGSADIFVWAATIDFNQNLLVQVAFCDVVDPSVKYRLHIDHTSPFFDDVNSCSTTSDDTMKRHRGRNTGPGNIEVSTFFAADDGLTYTVNIADLSPDIMGDDTLYVWLDTQKKGIQDRAPDTNGEDGCSKPEVGGEASPVVVNCVGSLTLNNNGTVYKAIEGNFTPPLSDLGGDITGDMAWIGKGGVANSELGCDTSPGDNVLDGLAVDYGESVAGKIALIQRDACFFDTKIKLAEDAGANAVVIFNHLGDDRVLMGAGAGFPITIPAVFVGQSVGEELAARREAGLSTNITLEEAQCVNSIP